MKKIFFYTLGCKVNQYETEALAKAATDAGYALSDDEKDADVYIINSCSVTAEADRKTRQLARRGKRFNKDATVIVVGCGVSVSGDELKKLPEIDRLIDAEEKLKLISALSVSGLKGRKKAYIKIQDGCDNFCAYCVVPLVRGRECSRPAAEIIAEAKEILANGYEEIVLTGINIAKYGGAANAGAAVGEGEGSRTGDTREAAGEGGSLTLPKLVHELAGLSGDFKITLSSLEPTAMDLPFVRELISEKKLTHKFHISLQSGSDKILKSMGRNYDSESYYEIVRCLRAFDPAFEITTDIIVGFPGETDADFAATLALADRCAFNHIHVFRYSKRKGTKACDMEGQIDEGVKRERSRELSNFSARGCGRGN